MQKNWLASYEKGLSGRLDYPPVALPQVLRTCAAGDPAREALIYLDHHWTYGELDGLASRTANLLRALGLAPGDRVGIHLPNCPQFVFGYFGILRSGGIAVPINPHFTGDDLAFVLADSGMRAVITSVELAPALTAAARPDLRVIVTETRGIFPADRAGRVTAGTIRLEEALAGQQDAEPGINIKPEDIANLQYTGGTTGRAKGAMLTHRNLVANALQFRHFFKNVYADGDGRFVCVIPLFHIYGLTTSMITAVISRSSMLLLPKFDLNDLMRAIDRHKPNLFMGVPAMYGSIALREGHDYDLSSIKACMSGSAPLPATVLERFERITGGKLREGYGLSEASPVVALNPIYGRVKPGSVGVPMPDTEVKVVDPQTGRDLARPNQVGELLVKGPQVMQGYWRQPGETADVLRDGWLHTGDLGCLDEDGYIHITDRLKDMIITGGDKVYPREVEDLLYTHPSVREAAVVGVPHPLRGEVPQAYVVLREGAAASPADLRKFCAAHLSRFKVPHRIEFVEVLPRNSVGKVLRRVLREKAAEA